MDNYEQKVFEYLDKLPHKMRVRISDIAKLDPDRFIMAVKAYHDENPGHIAWWPTFEGFTKLVFDGSPYPREIKEPLVVRRRK